MEDRTVQFALWYPHYRIEGGRLTCSVDVSPLTDVLLEAGDTELMKHFMEQLGLGSGNNAEWTLHGFNSPFYSIDIDADDFEDWMSPAWRLRLVFDNWRGPAPPEPPSPIPAWGYDQTWWAHRTPWDWNAHETIVIAFNGPEPDLDFLARVGEAIEVETVVHKRPKFNVGELRLSLGRMSLPSEADAVLDVVLACDREAMAVHTDHAMHLMEQM